MSEPVPTPQSDDRAPASIHAAFRRKRDELGIRDAFTPEVVADAERAAARGPAPDALRRPLLEVPFITIDPPGSRDLDQAVCIQPLGAGFRLWYAIADVGAWVQPGSATEREAWLRGVTFYSPDGNARLYPPALSEGAASLLPGVERPAVVFAFELDERAEIRTLTITRATIHSRAQLTYTEALERAGRAGGPGPEPWAATLSELRRFGELRIARERERGGVSIPIAEQHVQRTHAAQLGFEVEYETPNAAEDWNAQVSLLTGHAAALRMRQASVGMLRSMPPVEPARVDALRRAAIALGFAWPAAMPYPEFIRSIPVQHPLATVLLWQARRVGGASDYVAFQGALPAVADHAALAMPYAHVTAPLRRLGDRYVLDLLVALERGAVPPAPLVDALLRLPPVMNEADRKSGALDRAVVDVVEAFLLADRVGERFSATVLGVRGGRVEVQLAGVPIRAELRGADAAPALGSAVTVQLRAATIDPPQLDFVLA